ncbi:MAG: ABC transporter substrate-binding protein [Planctomycetota bacterium]|jgi:branched-chain amino acid transport system substrate-binding protein|nr:ABC transporter substrate-binding protein [Planctomycetota bacterium]
MFRWMLTALALVLILTGRARTGEADSSAFSGEIMIGATFPLTGKFSYYAQSAYCGVITRIRQINQAGGVNGKRLSIIWRDNQSQAEQAIKNIEELVEKHRVSAVIGPLMSDVLIDVRPAAERLGVPLVTPLASMESAVGGHPWIFGIAANSSLQAAAMAAFQIDKFGAKTCAIIYDQVYRSSVNMAEIFRSKFTDLGGKVTAQATFRAAGGVKDYLGALRAVEKDNPDFIFAVCYGAEAAELIYASREIGMNIRFCGPEEWDNEELFIGAGTRLAGTVICSSLFEESSRYRPFQRFMAEIRIAGMDEPDAQAALAYDAVSFLAAGLDKSESPEGLRSALDGVKNMNMATGRTSVGAKHNIVKPVLIRVMERRGDRLVPIYAERYDP